MGSALEILWVEKYRPRRLDEIVNQKEVVGRLKKFVREKNMPHLLFAGPAGTGKTTAALALAQDLYGEAYAPYLLELNASVSGETPVMVSLPGFSGLMTFRDLDRIYFGGPGVYLSYNGGDYVRTPGLRVLTVDRKTLKARWGEATWLIRHRAGRLFRVWTSLGTYIEVTGNHSVITVNRSGELVERPAASLIPGDQVLYLPALRDSARTPSKLAWPQEGPGLGWPGQTPLRAQAETQGLSSWEAISNYFGRLEGAPASLGAPSPEVDVHGGPGYWSLELEPALVTRVEEVYYGGYVYDVSVPGSEAFLAGIPPVLLHNSDERGINVIREKVKEFARSRTPPEIPFKIVLLDEADNMTGDAQQALRRLMELYSASTRFILIANYPSKIIDPIQSRCAFFRFTPLGKEDVVERLRFIAEKEGVEFDFEALETIYEISEGDMRKAINILQASAAIGRVTVDTVFRVVGMARPREVREMLKAALGGDFNAAREMLRKVMIEYGLSGEDLVKQIHREIFSGELDLSDEVRVLIVDHLAEVHFRLVEGSDDDIQLSSFLAWLALLSKRIGGARP